jgi:carbonyl reductase 1
MVPATFPTTRVAVVTGANKGIGYFIALQLGLSGLFSKIILGCRDPNKGGIAASAMNEIAGGKAHFQYMPLTIGDMDSHTSFFQRMQEEFGKVDVLVNNAGFAYKGSDLTPFEEQTEKTLAINFNGLVDFTETMLPLLRKGDDPRLVNVASKSGQLKQVSPALQKRLTDDSLTIPELNKLIEEFAQAVKAGDHKQKGWSSSNYGISKLGVIAATRIWSREEAGRISVNSCCPGYCATDMSSHGGPRPAEEGARNAVIPATMEDPPNGGFFSNYEPGEW